jgi:hypothetical protein
MMKPFKFFQKEERVFTQWMDEMDDYHLGDIRHRVEERDAVHIGDIMNELVNSIQVLNEQIENDTQ